MASRYNLAAWGLLCVLATVSCASGPKSSEGPLQAAVREAEPSGTSRSSPSATASGDLSRSIETDYGVTVLSVNARGTALAVMVNDSPCLPTRLDGVTEGRSTVTLHVSVSPPVEEAACLPVQREGSRHEVLLDEPIWGRRLVLSTANVPVRDDGQRQKGRDER